MTQNMARLAMNKHGTHVIVKFIQLAPLHNLGSAFAEIKKNFIDFANDQNGLPLIKVSLKVFSADKEKRKAMIKIMEANVVSLAQN